MILRKVTSRQGMRERVKGLILGRKKEILKTGSQRLKLMKDD